MRLIITDVTEMHAGNYCVAGWNHQTQQMIRPLPNGANWTAGLLDLHGVVPGAVIAMNPTDQQHQSAYPHRIEDTPVSLAGIQNVSAGPFDWFGVNAPVTYETVAEAFDEKVTFNSIRQNVRQGAYVPVGTQVRSLSAVRLPQNALQFVEDHDKLKCILDDGRAQYKLAVSSLALKTSWRQGGLQAVRRALPSSQEFHIRLGLARAFEDQPEQCYLMVNGVHG